MRVGRQVNVLLHFAFGSQELQAALSSNIQAVVLSFGNDGSLDHVSSAKGLFVLFVGENVFSCNHSFSGSVLAWLSGRKRNDFAGEFPFHHQIGTRLSATRLDQGNVSSAGVASLKLVVTHLYNFLTDFAAIIRHLKPI